MNAFFRSDSHVFVIDYGGNAYYWNDSSSNFWARKEEEFQI